MDVGGEIGVRDAATYGLHFLDQILRVLAQVQGDECDSVILDGCLEGGSRLFGSILTLSCF